MGAERCLDGMADIGTAHADGICEKSTGLQVPALQVEEVAHWTKLEDEHGRLHVRPEEVDQTFDAWKQYESLCDQVTHFSSQPHELVEPPSLMDLLPPSPDIATDGA